LRRRQHQARINADPFEHRMKRAKLECPIRSVVEMLHVTEAFAKTDPSRQVRVARHHQPQPRAPPRRCYGT
jgi:hypothetical protein